jgi:aminopeptidase-like protein
MRPELPGFHCGATRKMSISNLLTGISMDAAGREMYDFIAELYPICRSITGNGLRETLGRVGRRIPLQVSEVPSGTQVFDWTVPREWNIRDAYVKDANGRRVIDFRRSNLHVVSYSAPVKASMALSELRPRLHSLPEYPDWIPYRTSYYKENWGFCVTQKQLEGMEEGTYEVCIDSTLENGSMSYGECVIRGREESEVLFSCHTCHPSLCNDNLSGVSLATFLASHLSNFNLRYTYRFLFLPGTIGSISWLSRNEANIGRIKHGLVLACLGDPGKLTYKKSRNANAEIDKAAIHVLQNSGRAFSVLDFSPYGYDERQYCSPGFNLPVGSLMRSPHHGFPEYHTSADDLNLVRPECLADSLAICLEVLDILENNRIFLNTNPKCEPQLGKRGLYRSDGGTIDSQSSELATLWVLNLSDGSHSLLDIAERSGASFSSIQDAASALVAHGLLTETSGSDRLDSDWHGSPI